MNITKKDKFARLLNKSLVIFDGAMGTELQKRGLKPGEPSELLNFTAPKKVAEVIRSYAESGSDIVSANTFCANSYKLSEIGKTTEETVFRAVKIAREAVIDFPEVLIALDIGPIGQLLRPSGTLSFDEAYDIFAEIVKAGNRAGADLVALQTFSDLRELKCAILAVKENSDLPVICSMTFESGGRTFTGCPVSAFAITADGLGADAIGVNCSLGPAELAEVAEEMAKWSDLPLVVKPNAGLPDPVTGKFAMNADDFASQMKSITAIPNVKIVGGCCGTSPEYIRLLSGFSDSRTPPAPRKTIPAVCSGVRTVTLDCPRVIGERINPTGKRIFREALLNSDTDYILRQAFEQVRAGADILDVNVGLPGIDERQTMLQIMEALQGVCDLPLQIDSNSDDVIESALRHYSGKPILNSVNGKEESLSQILPIAKKYGAMLIGLTLDERGIPETAEERLEIARKIMERALEVGFKKEYLIIDCLTMTVSTDSKAAKTTLQAVKAVKTELGLKTALGVSNISFGLPNRELINSAFLTMALQNGLDLPIINPNALTVMNSVRAFKLLNSHDENAKDFIATFSGQSDLESGVTNKTVDNSDSLTEKVAEKEIKEMSIGICIQSGMKKDGAALTAKLLETVPAITVVNEHLIPVLDRIGAEFETGKIFLPQLILAAETAGVCFDVVKKSMSGESADNSGLSKLESPKIILATVEGDVHDIGKNIVKVILENYGYHIIDLGKNVPPQAVVESARKNSVNLIGLSALMTTTLPAMSRTIELLRESELKCKVMVGGAILTAEYAVSIGADYYAKDAKGAVDIAKKVFN